ncbi:hypothetical protein DPMN_172702 [Dreissena polymorpha]|uniref:Uncharacterized protein n=1 Tax=Dreissena polymorpha TaxID=45954 RepID=A0A9D4E2U7_DREPO|nr:hypothetical protein DPMN_172702 [Dreissena polymorpha]
MFITPTRNTVDQSVGEADWATPHLYACQFEAMISDWRAKFHQASKNQTSVMFPFGFVQVQDFVISDN